MSENCFKTENKDNGSRLYSLIGCHSPEVALDTCNLGITGTVYTMTVTTETAVM